jgi:hypothetical protein
VKGFIEQMYRPANGQRTVGTGANEVRFSGMSQRLGFVFARRPERR